MGVPSRPDPGLIGNRTSILRATQWPCHTGGTATHHALPMAPADTPSTPVIRFRRPRPLHEVPTVELAESEVGRVGPRCVPVGRGLAEGWPRVGRGSRLTGVPAGARLNVLVSLELPTRRGGPWSRISRDIGESDRHDVRFVPLTSPPGIETHTFQRRGRLLQPTPLPASGGAHRSVRAPRLPEAVAERTH